MKTLKVRKGETVPLHMMKISARYDGPSRTAAPHSLYCVGVMIDEEYYGEDAIASTLPSDVTEEEKLDVLLHAFIMAARKSDIRVGDIVKVIHSPKIGRGTGDNLKVPIPSGRFQVLSIVCDNRRKEFFTDKEERMSSTYLWRLHGERH